VLLSLPLCFWHADMQRPSETVCLRVNVCADVYNALCMFVCLPEVSVFNMQPDGNCFCSLSYCSAGSFRLLHCCPFLCSSPLQSFTFSSLLSSSFLPCSTAPVPTRASIHNSSIALATDCAEDNSTDSQTKHMKT